jgi:hypothetical protein
MNIDDWIGLTGLVLGLISFFGGGLMWYRGSIVKGYAASRAFEHLRRNQENLGQAIAEIDKAVDGMTVSVQALSGAIDTIALSVRENTLSIQTLCLTTAKIEALLLMNKSVPKSVDPS